ncbi:hypothetical protein B4064_3139 [Caldibacillus thermoamylovorans]|nr:hypothetical protein B4064_3139 [Caldibacillus thermoamylovorans]
MEKLNEKLGKYTPEFNSPVSLFNSEEAKFNNSVPLFNSNHFPSTFVYLLTVL